MDLPPPTAPGVSLSRKSLVEVLSEGIVHFYVEFRPLRDEKALLPTYTGVHLEYQIHASLPRRSPEVAAPASPCRHFAPVCHNATHMASSWQWGGDSTMEKQHSLTMPPMDFENGENTALRPWDDMPPTLSR